MIRLMMKIVTKPTAKKFGSESVKLRGIVDEDFMTHRFAPDCTALTAPLLSAPHGARTGSGGRGGGGKGKDEEDEDGEVRPVREEEDEEHSGSRRAGKGPR